MSIDHKTREIIEQSGYITCDRLMQEALHLSPTSYYKQTKSLGEEGDFITAPEVSQLFGEIIGLWCIKEWQRIGSPKNLNIVELGPGRGLLMRDLLRTAKLVPEFYNALSINLIDINENLIIQQKSNLQNFDLPINWYASIEDIPKKPALIIANEFFDAMPIKQYIKVKELWYERIFVVQPVDGKIKYDKIAVSKQLQDYLQKTHLDAKDGAVLEESYNSIEIMKFMSEHIKELGGSGLIIDYGYDINPNIRTRHQYNSTLQAIKNHKYCPVIENLGEADLSAHVDFYVLKTVAQNSKINVIDTISQRDFLIENGILLRKQTIQDKLNPQQAQLIERQVDRLISVKEMGGLFKVLQVMKTSPTVSLHDQAGVVA
ncbi:class I SAM-dependent methyltransferase [Rickettsia endosymbiont of Pantilius tunicatus]|uniref:class I SAM-dependent methyltransferase n=1 Tax=Rickettsia endosymbiont of Pantilius tunicatus TaxID=3066267 RepID=UPI0030E42B84